MAFEKREVTRYNNLLGHVTLPAELIGSKVYLVTDREAIDLEELVTKTLMFRKMDRLEQREFKEALATFQRDVGYRLTMLENAVYGTRQEPATPTTPKAAD